MAINGDAPQPRSFQTTHWSLVARAGSASSQLQREALGLLIERYAPALRAHLMTRKGRTADEADDLLQAFLASKVVEQAIMAQAAPDRGRFRTFILTALDRFVVSQYRHQRARKRYAGPMVEADEELELPAPGASPDLAFEVAWGRNVVHEALRRMQEECERTGRVDIWGVFEARLVSPLLGGDVAAVPSYDELVGRFGFASPIQASNVLITAKRMFIRVIRGVVGEYELAEDHIDAEIAALKGILAGPRG
jgi:RNA polymerase sigma-70 factor (ECF subfamily)